MTNNMDYASSVVLNTVKPGDMVEIKPISKVPNCERRFRVDDITKEGFLYGLSETCDGYIIPFNWIDKIKIVK